jgi:hypothetical protein
MEVFIPLADYVHCLIKIQSATSAIVIKIQLEYRPNSDQLAIDIDDESLLALKKVKRKFWTHVF